MPVKKLITLTEENFQKTARDTTLARNYNNERLRDGIDK